MCAIEGKCRTEHQHPAENVLYALVGRRSAIVSIQLHFYRFQTGYIGLHYTSGSK